MSLFHAAAQPKVQLRKRALHMRAYLRSRIFRDAANIDATDTMHDVIDVLEGDPDATDIEYAQMSVDELEGVYDKALTWRDPRDDENLALGITGAWAIVMGVITWLSWKYEPPAPTTFVLPLLVVDPDELLALRNAKAA